MLLFSMRSALVRCFAFAALALGACERLAEAPKVGFEVPPLPRGPDVRPFEGQTFPEFLSQEGMAQFELAALGLADRDIRRFQAAHGQASPSHWVVGGGVEALVFYGCSSEGCDAATSVLAVDGVTGETFVGVRDAAGAEILVPNLRLEALLRLGSTTGAWDDPTPRAQPTGP